MCLHACVCTCACVCMCVCEVHILAGHCTRACVCACVRSVCFCVHVQIQLHTVDLTNLVGVGRGGLKRF